MLNRSACQRWLKRLTPSPSTVLLLGLVVYFWYRPPAWVSNEHHPVADIALPLSNGQTITLASLRGKVVLVSFWATWCPYCRHELPDIQSFYSDWHNKGFDVLALSIDDDPTLVPRFMRAQHYNFPAGIADNNTQQIFGGIEKIPMSFIIDKRGIIRYKISGQVYYARLTTLITPLLKE